MRNHRPTHIDIINNHRLVFREPRKGNNAMYDDVDAPGASVICANNLVCELSGNQTTWGEPRDAIMEPYKVESEREEQYA